MALMEYCLVNIVLGDTAIPKPTPPPPPPEPPQPEPAPKQIPEAPKIDKLFSDYAPPKVIALYC